MIAPLPPPRAICFDLDQTLVQHTRPMSEVLTEALTRRAPERSAALPAFTAALQASGARHWAEVAECAGRGAGLLTLIIEDALDASGFERAFAAGLLRDMLSGITQSTRPTAHAASTLDRLHARGIAIGVVTNGLTILQTAKLHAHGLHERVAVVATSEAAGAHKPDSSIFRYALERLGVAPNQAWHVGDNYEKDVLGARGAGMTGILFTGTIDGDAGRPSSVLVDDPDLIAIADLPALSRLAGI